MKKKDAEAKTINAEAKTQESAAEEKTITPAEKAAAFIVALGEDTAAEIYKHLDDDEIEQLSLEIASINHLSQEQIKDVMDEFYNIFIAQKISAEGGQQYSMNVLINAFGAEKAKMIMQRIHDSNRAFEFLKNVDYKTILTLLANEMPQTIALVITHINSKKSAQILAEFPNDIQVEIFKRIADMDSISPEIVRNVEEIMEQKLNSVGSVNTVEFGGVNYLADVMNNLDMQTEKTIMEELNDSDPELPFLTIVKYRLSSENATQRISQLLSRRQIRRSQRQYSAICPSVSRKLSRQTCSICIMSVCVTLKTHRER